MKTLAAILVVFLFWGSVMPKNDFSELAKFSHLIKHFNEHSEKTPLSFLDFIEMHYGSKKDNHKDGHEDKGCLPLQKSTASVGTVFVFSNNTLLSLVPQQAKNESISCFIPATLSVQSTPPWHPPKA